MKEIQKFTGFTQATFDFFAGLKENNYKPWFEEHKPVYEHEVLLPLRALVLAMTPVMYSIDSQMDFRPNKTISRIYRDIRFSADKSPYKTNMWIMFQRIVPNWEGFPGFYMEITSDSYQYGMGLYMAKKNIMDEYRAKMEYEPESFRQMTENLVGKHRFVLGGDEYKRPINNSLPDYFQTWFQRKNIYLYKICPIGKELFDEGFAKHLSDEFTLMQPFYNFLTEICV
ncbi:MAG: DUF2461 domain-containing protein [Candidatus Azobacteroides sp.]|nr:DUF2461 domain-containing protein [Candidatus Azobacteroides sp.]